MPNRIFAVLIILTSIVIGLPQGARAQGNRVRFWITCPANQAASIYIYADGYPWPEVWFEKPNKEGPMSPDEVQPKIVNPHGKGINNLDYRFTARFSDGYVETHEMYYRYPNSCSPAQPGQPPSPTATPTLPPPPTATPTLPPPTVVPPTIAPPTIAPPTAAPTLPPSTVAPPTAAPTLPPSTVAPPTVAPTLPPPSPTTTSTLPPPSPTTTSTLPPTPPIDMFLIVILLFFLLGVIFIFTYFRANSSTSQKTWGQTPSSAQTLPAPYILSTPQTLPVAFILQNRYRIVQQLGRGGQANVYLAQHLGLGGKHVALKQNIGGNPQQFQQEAILLANLQHPNLPRVLDHFVEPNGAAYLVMDFIEGQDLDTFVAQRGAVAENVALQWLRPMFGALKYLHANGIIHRDIKPANIIITPQGRAMLVDFGIAKISVRGGPTATNVRGMGTAGFAPPEQYSGGTTERSDIYALGATLYYVLSAHMPEEAPKRAAGAPIIPLRQLNGAISARTAGAIAIAMNLDAQQRFATIALMEQALY